MAAKPQPTLSMFFAKKPKPAAAAAAATVEQQPKPSEEQPEQVAPEGMKRKEAAPAEEEKPNRKRRAVLESDSEEEDGGQAVQQQQQPKKTAEGAADQAAAAASDPFSALRDSESDVELDDEPVADAAPEPKKSPAKAPEAKKAAEKKPAAAGGFASIFNMKKPIQKAKKAQSDEQSKKSATAAVASAAAATKKEKAAAAAAGPVGSADGAPAALQYRELAACLDQVGSTTKRLEITKHMSDFVRSVLKKSPASLAQCLYLSINKLGPDHDNIELGVGDSLLIKAIAQSTGRTPEKIKKDFKESGDLGELAMAAKGAQKTLGFGAKPKPLTVPDIFGALRKIADCKGNGSQQERVNLIKGLLVRAVGSESKFIIRHCQGKLRIGMSDKTVLVSCAHAFAQTVVGPSGVGEDRKFRGGADKAKENAERVLKHVFCSLPDWGVVLPVMIEAGEKWEEVLPEKCHLTPGVPIHPMLAKPTKGISEVLDRFADVDFTCEYKYDGERAQVHLKEDGTVKIFSRSSLDDTHKFTEVVESFASCVAEGVTSCIIDSECVAYDLEKKTILPFQDLSKRKKKLAEGEKQTIAVALFAFDLIYLNGKSLIKETLRERRDLLHKNIKHVEGKMHFATYNDGKDTEEIQKFLDDSIAGNCEGLMVKSLDGADSSYEPSNRSQNWLKVKKDYVDGLTDSFDLVPIGAWRGKGKRMGVYGAYLLACYDDDDEVYQTICKIGTGFNDEALKTLTEQLKPHIIDGPPGYYSYGEGPNVTPDVWFSPETVWEVMAADLSISPTHHAAAGLVDDTKGISLRFPRYLRTRYVSRLSHCQTQPPSAHFDCSLVHMNSPTDMALLGMWHMFAATTRSRRSVRMLRKWRKCTATRPW